MCLTAAVAQYTNYKQIDLSVQSKEAAAIPGSPTWNIPPSHHASFRIGINNIQYPSNVLSRGNCIEIRR